MRNYQTVNKLLKSQCLNSGFHFFGFKSNWLPSQKNKPRFNQELTEKNNQK